MGTDRVQAPLTEGVGLVFPVRNPAHADPQWYECDLDDPIEDPDSPAFDPLPTARHREVPGA
jgi:hypothetical protein